MPSAPAKLTENAPNVLPSPTAPSVAELKTTTVAVQSPPIVTETRPPIAPTIEPTLPSSSSGALADEQYPETRNRLLSQAEVRNWSDGKLRYAINELYARGGYDFQNPEIKAIFSRSAWYRQRYVAGRSQEAAAAHLSRTEYVNLELLQKIRDSRR
jgi:hypothetical protein